MIVLTKQNWEKEVLKADKPVVVDFWGPGCAPCRQLEPLLQEAEEEFGSTFKFGKVNTSTDGPIAIRYGVRALPTLLLFSNGEVKGSAVGSLGKKALMNLLHTHC